MLSNFKKTVSVLVIMTAFIVIGIMVTPNWQPAIQKTVESSEWNFGDSEPRTDPNGPDLKVENIALVDILIISGDGERIDFIISNSGMRDAANVHAHVCAVQGGETIVKEITVPTIKTGESYSDFASWHTLGLSGDFGIKVVVDPHNTIIEANEANYTWLGRTLIVEHAPFALGTTYSVTISGEATDLAGNRLDGNNNGIAEGAPSDNYTFSFTTVSTINVPPALADAHVFPELGFSGDNFTFTTNYTDANDDPPANISLHLTGPSGGIFPMIPVSPSDDNYADSREYRCTLALEAGAYSYRVCASDGTSWANTTEYSKPTVMQRLALEIGPDVVRHSRPKTTETVVLTIENRGLDADTIDLTLSSVNGWNATLSKENGEALSDTDSDGMADVGELPGSVGESRVALTVAVPAGALADAQAIVVVTAHSSKSANTANCSMTIIVNRTCAVALDNRKNAKSEYTLEVRNDGNSADAIDVSYEVLPDAKGKTREVVVEGAQFPINESIDAGAKRNYALTIKAKDSKPGTITLRFSACSTTDRSARTAADVRLEIPSSANPGPSYAPALALVALAVVAALLFVALRGRSKNAKECGKKQTEKKEKE